jgi:hypothetical protein
MFDEQGASWFQSQAHGCNCCMQHSTGPAEHCWHWQGWYTEQRRRCQGFVPPVLFKYTMHTRSAENNNSQITQCDTHTSSVSCRVRCLIRLHGLQACGLSCDTVPHTLQQHLCRRACIAADSSQFFRYIANVIGMQCCCLCAAMQSLDMSAWCAEIVWGVLQC